MGGTECKALIERDSDWYVAYCPETPGANGQGGCKYEAEADLAEAIARTLEDTGEDRLRGIPADAEGTTVVLE